MATNHVHPHTIPSQTHFDQQVFVVYGPLPKIRTPWQTLRKRMREHSFWTILIAAGLLFGLRYLWTMLDYVGAATIYDWRVEILSISLSLLILFLFFTFRRWERERQRRVRKRAKSAPKINALLCTPPPLPVTTDALTNEEFTITIEYWASDEPVRLTEESSFHAQLPDEFLAPDALVLNVEIQES
ncbi:MAG TPA: hypothetical protein VFZ34_14195 [Blastocatellia bacterium]|nr:hypothetical protein [Blastocatellia bacterium]